MRYRAEIDGLRAVAVVPVLFFHAGSEFLSGGFAGVDVFFVISGYLITSIILGEMDRDRFSLVNFYERRARRILPALTIVCAVTFVYGWFNYLPDELKSLSVTMGAVALFVSNMYFWVRATDYFGLEAESNPLLHTWSLAVEEQYYIVFPILLMLIWRFGKDRIGQVLIAILIVSLFAGSIFGGYYPTSGFYLLPMRAWELVIGALAALYVNRYGEDVVPRVHHQVLSAVGLLLIFASLVLYDATTPTYGLYGLAPTVGAVLIILCATEGTWAHRILSHSVMVGIGLISYSMYLWHQPLFSFVEFEGYHISDTGVFLLASAATIVLAILTKLFVEDPFRNKTKVTRAMIFSLSGASLAAMVAIGVLGHQNAGFPDRDPIYARFASNYGLSLACNGNTELAPECVSQPPAQIAVLGDSYAMHLVEGLLAADDGVSVAQFTQDSCMPTRTFELARPGALPCAEFVERAIETITASPEITHVVISSTFNALLFEDHHKGSLTEMIGEFQRSGKDVVLVGPTPGNGSDFAKCVLRAQRNGGPPSECDFAASEIYGGYFSIIKILEAVSTETNTPLINLAEYICPDDICVVHRDDVFVYRDAGHLSREGSRYILGKVFGDGRILKSEL